MIGALPGPGPIKTPPDEPVRASQDQAIGSPPRPRTGQDAPGRASTSRYKPVQGGMSRYKPLRAAALIGGPKVPIETDIRPWAGTVTRGRLRW
ncbi:hypothetical protein GCM10018952_37590 [Streptosporangium vulgare]